MPAGDFSPFGAMMMGGKGGGDRGLHNFPIKPKVNLQAQLGQTIKPMWAKTAQEAQLAFAMLNGSGGKGGGGGGPATQWPGGGGQSWGSGGGGMSPMAMMRMMQGMGGQGFMPGMNMGGGMGQMPGMAGVGGGPERVMLIQRVKAVQKQEGGKEKWYEFVASHGGGKKDPMAKSNDELKEFLLSADPGGGSLDAVKGGGSEAFKLAQQVRNGQKFSDEFKEAWHEYAEKNCGNVKDPAKHDVETLQSFLAIAPVVIMPENDSNHQGLVQRIKAGQRKSEDFKNAWHQYCQNNGSMKFDPVKHESYFLQQFLMSTPEPEEADEPAMKKAKN